MSKLQKKPSALKRGHPTLQNMNFYQFFSTFVSHFCPPGSGSGFRIRIRIHWPDWIRIRSGSETLLRRAKMSQKSRKVKKFYVLKCWMFFFECFSLGWTICIGLRIGKLQFAIKKNMYITILKLYNFLHFWSSKPWIWIRIRIDLKC